MIVGTCLLKLRIYDSNSLKDKRHAIKSIVERIQSRFNVSIAEIDLNDNWEVSIVGFACVSNSTNHANQILSNVINFVDGDSRVEIIEHEIEIL